MKTLPIIKPAEVYSSGTLRSYYRPDAYDHIEIDELTKGRLRFNEVRTLLEKMSKISSCDFDRYFSNRYYICAGNVNDARLAMIMIYNKIAEKSYRGIKEYIVSIGAFEFLGEGLSTDDDDISFWDNEDDIEERNEDDGKNSAAVLDFAHVSGEPLLSPDVYESEGYNVQFVLEAHGNYANQKETAENNGYIYLSIPNESLEELRELFTEKLNKEGYTCGDVKDELEEFINQSKCKSEYDIECMVKRIINKQLLLCPEEKSICAEALRKNGSSKPNRKKGVKLIALEKEREKINGIIKMLELEKRRMDKGIISQKNGCNMVFAGPPGTAKTTLAREFANTLADMGLIKSGRNFKECRKSDIVGQYVGHTAEMVDKMFSNMNAEGGGVIFFDEIYTLSEKDATIYDIEAINCIIQNMENYRDKVYCIFAGYENKMESFLSANPGMRSRIQFVVRFDEYDINTLCDIFVSIAQSNSFTVARECGKTLKSFFKELKTLRADQFGNGREARNLFVNAVQKLAIRIGSISDLNVETLSALTAADIQAAADDIISSEKNESDAQPRRIGFVAGNH